MTDIEEIEKRIRHWDARDRAEAQRMLELAQTTDIRLWYCDRGRKCDGKPHGEFDYPHARGSQWPPVGHDWFVWFARAGRSWGKTATGSNWVRNVARKLGADGRIALIGRTGPEFRKTMIEGRSGLINICKAAGETFDWKPALKTFTFQNGCQAFGYSGEEPDSLRGPEHHAAWLDEPSHMAEIEDVWSNLLFGLRLPGLPGGVKIYCSSTPLPNDWTKELSQKESTRLVIGSSFENIDNLDERFRETLLSIDGTRLGRQEIYGELLEDVEGALWKTAYIQHEDFETEDLDRIIIAIDPAGSKNKRSDLTGIVAAGINGDKGYVIDDKSGRMSPQGWARAAMKMYERLRADAIVVETNFGGDMVRRTLEAESFSGRVIESRAVRGKQTRAEPIVALYEQKKIVHQLNGNLNELENEMLSWVPGTGPSPNRVDATVWAFTELFKGKGAVGYVSARNLTMGNGGPSTSSL